MMNAWLQLLMAVTMVLSGTLHVMSQDGE